MSPGIKLLIANAAISSNKKREQLAEDLLEDIEKKYPSEIPPTLETIVKLISKYRNHGQSYLDRPWNLGELDNLAKLNIGNFDSEAIKYIYVVTQLHRKEPIYPIVTIRQSKWIARLYQIVSEIYPNNNEKRIIYLSFASVIYAAQEIMSEITGITFDTQLLDTHLHSPKSFFDLYYEIVKDEDFKKALDRFSHDQFEPDSDDKEE
jgi:hypothetical protein